LPVLFDYGVRLHSHDPQCVRLHPQPAVQRAGKDRIQQLGRHGERDFAMKSGCDRRPDGPYRIDRAAGHDIEAQNAERDQRVN
jgi:hypothetical protein